MRPPVSNAAIVLALHLLDKGVSQRQIAKKLCLGRDTLNAIASGKLAPQEKVWQDISGFPTDDLDNLPDLSVYPDHRCKGCGATINTKECLLCFITAQR